MKDFSLFFLKNALGARMKKGFKNLCNNDTSTSTLDQNKPDDRCLPCSSSATMAPPLAKSPGSATHPTLEEMIFKLEMEESLTRRLKADDQFFHHRMSCVNSSDILRSARNALNQYPRFSLDGKDSLYRCSFADSDPVKRRTPILPDAVAGESVVWCNPGVVAKLMGLDVIPIPLNTRTSGCRGRRERLGAMIKRQRLKRLTAEQCEVMERRRFTSAAGADDASSFGARKREAVSVRENGSCSTNARHSCVTRAVGVELPNGHCFCRKNQYTHEPF